MLNVGQDEAEFQQAMALRNRGQMQEADAVCQRILQRNPKHAGAMHLAGILAFGRGDAAKAMGLIEGSIAIVPQADAYANLAEIRRQMGDLDAAVALARKSLAMDANGPTAHLHLAMALLGQRKLDEALVHAKRVVELWQNSGRGQALAGVILMELGRAQEAARMLEDAIRRNPSEIVPLMNLGMACRQISEFDKAVEAHQRALALAPNHPGVWMHLGISMAQAKRYDEAKLWLEKTVAACPNDVDPVQNLATLYVEMHQFERGLEWCRRGVEMDPKRGLMWIAMQKSYTGLGRFAEAEEAINRAAELGDSASIHKARAHTRTMAAEPERALEAAELAIAAEPTNARFHFDKAVTLLTLGRFEEGWAEYEWRRELPEIKVSAPVNGPPDWKGEELEGKTILLYAEQGFGDAIQFVRYVPMVKARGGRIVVACQKPLKRLFSRIVGGGGDQGWGEGEGFSGGGGE
ncbi:MAG: tetratricopeptide repeat protein, partial [Phycisphaerales bacterium]|nr:tetratricopeptide repeat protein [Phycisphaerales bacterium]